jgi:hypothetical protein
MVPRWRRLPGEFFTEAAKTPPGFPPIQDFRRDSAAEMGTRGAKAADLSGGCAGPPLPSASKVRESTPQFLYGRTTLSLLPASVSGRNQEANDYREAPHQRSDVEKYQPISGPIID